MKIKIIKEKSRKELEVDILCNEKANEVERLYEYISNFSKSIICYFEHKEFQIAIHDILYFESVDSKTFAYTDVGVYETNYTLASLEALLGNDSFVRIGKSCILNIHMLQHVEPYQNHRLLATLKNGESQIISRFYINNLRTKMKTFY